MTPSTRTPLVPTKCKYVVALLGTTLIAAVVWNRRQVDDNIVKYQLHGDDRVLPRSKRQAAMNNLNNIYNQFDSVQGCCQTPNLLMAEAFAFCHPPGLAKKRMQAQKQGQRNNNNNNNDQGWFGAIRNLYMPPPIVKTVKNGKRKGREAPQKIGLASVCYTDCLFNSLGFMNGSALELNKIETHFVEKSFAGGSWKEIIQNSLFTCEEPAACATPETVYVNGKFCNIKPTIMMNCMRKQMLLNCPGAVQSSGCNTGMSQLKRTNVLSLG